MPALSLFLVAAEPAGVAAGSGQIIPRVEHHLVPETITVERRQPRTIRSLAGGTVI
jgi:hypothetical protein